jgi:hypothetical protein
VSDLKQAPGRSPVSGRASASPLAYRSVIWIGLVLTALYVAGAMLLIGRTGYDTWGAVLIGPILVIATLPSLARQAEREADPRVFAILVLALILKLGMSLVRYHVAFDIYGGRADARGYYAAGYHISENFLSGDFTTGLDSFTGTDFINLLTGIAFTITRPTMLGGFFLFAWLGFIGMFLFYRAFAMAVPEGKNRTYALLLFFLPSMLFWPSSIGKEAWMVFAMGVTAFGIAQVLTGRIVPGVAFTGGGLWLLAVVRPHIAGMMAIALVFGYLLKRPNAKHRELAPLVKIVTLVVLGGVALYYIGQTREFLNAASVTEALSETAEVTSKGGSEFDPANPFSPTGLPLAAFTVLYRPTLLDAHNTQAALAAIEGTFLLILTIIRWRWCLAAILSVRRQPYVGFAIAFVGMFIVAFSSFANFGLLSRERVQMLPLFFVLLSVRPRVRSADQGDLEEPEASPARTTS